MHSEHLLLDNNNFETFRMSKYKRTYPVLRAPALCGVWGRMSKYNAIKTLLQICAVKYSSILIDVCFAFLE
jgi:hypothetical protein